MVRLLLSIDRRESKAAAMRTVELAADFHEVVVGVDLSGNPSIGEFQTWAPALQRARELGLKITLHAGEVSSVRWWVQGSCVACFKDKRLGNRSDVICH